MGTQAINNLMNEVYYGQSDNGKELTKDGDFLKAFENAQNASDLETLAKRDVNSVEELTGNESYRKEAKVVKNNNEHAKVENSKNVKNTETDSINENSENKCEDSREISDNIIELDEEDVEFIEENYGALVNAYVEILGIPEENVSEYFSENDLNLDALLSSDNVQNIVLGLENINDSSEILINQELYENIETLKSFTDEILSDISEELGLDNDETLNLVSNLLSEAQNLDEELLTVTNSEDIHVFESADDTEFDVIDIADKSDLNQPDISKIDRKSTDSKDEQSEGSSDSGNSFNANAVQSTDVYKEMTSFETKETLNTNSQAQEIYDQIGDFVRSVSTEELKEVTLQLQPENLGTLQIRVTQREGVLTAELLTQNDNVRAALESQMAELQKDFEKSGLKVEEIEVKVSTQSFDESSQEDARNEENEAAQREFAPRRINLNGIFDSGEEIEKEDEQKIAVEMMRANGNSLDYQA